MNKNIFSLSIVFSTLILSACSDNGTSADDSSFNASKVCPADGNNAYGEPNRGSFTDTRDNQVYKYTTIGNQVWMAQNLNYKTDESFCAMDDCVTKGQFYKLEEVKTVCPIGWHLPFDEEWLLLFDNMGGIDSAGYRLKTTSGWTPLNPGQLANGTDDCSFSLLPVPSSGIYSNNLSNAHDGYVALVWTASSSDEDHMNGALFETQNLNVQITEYFHRDLLSVRCVKD